MNARAHSYYVFAQRRAAVGAGFLLFSRSASPTSRSRIGVSGDVEARRQRGGAPVGQLASQVSNRSTDSHSSTRQTQR